MITGPASVSGPAVPLRRLLSRCTRNGVAVALVFPPRPLVPKVLAPPAGAESAPPQTELSAQETGKVLALARQEALSGLFSGWRIWSDEHGWHARRRQARYLQARASGAPAYCVHARTPRLAAQLCWQQAADDHASRGCHAG